MLKCTQPYKCLWFTSHWVLKRSLYRHIHARLLSASCHLFLSSLTFSLFHFSFFSSVYLPHTPPPSSCQSWHDLQIPMQSACKVISALCLFGPALFSYSKACCSSAWERNVSDKPKHISIALTCIPTIIPVSSPSKMLVWAVIHSSESLGHRTGQRKSVNIDLHHYHHYVWVNVHERSTWNQNWSYLIPWTL